MPPGRKDASGAPEGKEKIQRKAINLDVKMDIIKAYEGGKKVNVIGREMCMAKSTVSSILRDRERIKRAARQATGGQTAVIKKLRNGVFHEMENHLVTWIKEQVQKKNPLNPQIIQEEARYIFDELEDIRKGRRTHKFKASIVWYRHFRERFKIRLPGESDNELQNNKKGPSERLSEDELSDLKIEVTDVNPWEQECHFTTDIEKDDTSDPLHLSIYEASDVNQESSNHASLEDGIETNVVDIKDEPLDFGDGDPYVKEENDKDPLDITVLVPNLPKKTVGVKKKKKTKPPKKYKKRFRYTAYMLWAKEVRKSILKEEPNISFCDMNKQLGKLWRLLPPNSKYNWRRKSLRLSHRTRRPQVVHSSRENTKSTSPAIEISEHVLREPTTHNTALNEATANHSGSDQLSLPLPTFNQNLVHQSTSNHSIVLQPTSNQSIVHHQTSNHTIILHPTQYQNTFHQGISDQSIEHQSSSNQSIVHQPPSNRYIVHQPSSNHNIVHQPPSNQSLIHQPPSNHSIVHQPSSSHSIVHQPSSSHSIVHQPSTSHSIVHQPSSNSSIVHQPPSNHKIVHQPSSSHSIVHQPSSNNSIVNLPPSNHKIVHQSSSSHSIVHQPSSNQSIVQQQTSSSSIILHPTQHQNILHQPAANQNIVLLSRSNQNSLHQPIATEKILLQPTSNQNTLNQTTATRKILFQTSAFKPISNQKTYQPTFNENVLLVPASDQNQVSRPALQKAIDQSTPHQKTSNQSTPHQNILNHNTPHQNTANQTISLSNTLDQSTLGQTKLHEPMPRQNALRESTADQNVVYHSKSSQDILDIPSEDYLLLDQPKVDKHIQKCKKKSERIARLTKTRSGRAGIAAKPSLNFEPQGFFNMILKRKKNHIFLRTNAKTAEEALRWKDVYCKKHSLTFEHKWKKHEVRGNIYHEKFQCNGFAKIQGITNYTRCPVTMSIRIRDCPYIKQKFKTHLCSISIVGCHNHYTEFEKLKVINMEKAEKNTDKYCDIERDNITTIESGGDSRRDSEVSVEYLIDEPEEINKEVNKWATDESNWEPSSDTDMSQDSNEEINLESDQEEAKTDTSAGIAGSQQDDDKDEVVEVTGQSSQWSFSKYNPVRFSFMQETGITRACSATETSEEIDFFLEFFNSDLIDGLVTQINDYHERLTESKVELPNNWMLQWEPTNRNEMYLFLCLYMAMAHVKKHNLTDYWSSDFLISTPAFAAVMSQDRFLILLCHLHFSDNTDNVTKKRLETIINSMRHKFSAKFKPFQDLHIDESLELGERSQAFPQCVPSEQKRLEDKIFLICDSKTGYILDFISYTGMKDKVSINPYFSLAGSVVYALIGPYLGKGHNLFTKRWHTSPDLFEHLHKLRTGACGAVEPRRKGMPLFPSLIQGKVSACHKNNIMCLKWATYPMVYMLTSIHENKMNNKKDSSSGEVISTPEAVEDYSQKISINDKASMQFSVDSIRRAIKWDKKLFFHIVDMARLNAYYLYSMRRDTKLPFLNFSQTLLLQMISRFHSKQMPRAYVCRPITSSLRLNERHFPSVMKGTPNFPDPHKMCFVCANTELQVQKQEPTCWQCFDCRVALCMPKCFRIFHTQDIF